MFLKQSTTTVNNAVDKTLLTSDLTLDLTCSPTAPLSPPKCVDNSNRSAITPVRLLRRSPRLHRPKTPARHVGDDSSNGASKRKTCEVARVLPLSEDVVPISQDNVHRRLPAEKSKSPTELGALVLDEPNEPALLCKVYTYLHGLNKLKLRSVCKRLRCRLSGNKRELLFRSFLFLAGIHEKHCDVVSFMIDRVEFEAAKRFFEDSELVALNEQVLPSRGFMIEHLKAAGDKMGGAEAMNDIESGSVGAGTDPNFCHSEFARLIIIMRDDERAKEAIFALSQELRRPVLDAGMRRDSYWDVIAKRFNDATLKVKFD